MVRTFDMNLSFLLPLLTNLICWTQGKNSNREEAFKVNNAQFQTQIRALGALERSGYFGSSEHTSAADIVGSTDWNVGLAIEVENFSGKLLTDPRQHVVCGWKDSNYIAATQIEPGTRDVYMFHNFGKWSRNTCGSISWQIKNPDQTTYSVSTGKGLRVSVTWAVWYSSCGKKQHNEVTVNFFSVFVDKAGNWRSPSQNLIYGLKHKNIDKKTVKVEGEGRVAIAEFEEAFKARVSISRGCKAILKLQLLGMGEARLEEGTSQNRIEIREQETTTQTVTTKKTTTSLRAATTETIATTEKINEIAVKSSQFDEKIDTLKPSLPSGHFLKDDKTVGSAEEMIKKVNANVGVAIEVENLSNALLTNPYHHVRCGWEDSTLATPNEIESGTKDVFVFHNYNDGGARSSCGSISWQIKNSDDSALLVEEGKGIRLYLTWAVWYNSCGAKQVNEVTLHISQVSVDSSGNWKSPSQSSVYGIKHYIGKYSRNLEGHTVVSMAEILPSFSARATIKPGCLTVLSVQLIGLGDAKTAKAGPTPSAPVRRSNHGLVKRMRDIKNGIVPPHTHKDKMITGKMAEMSSSRNLSILVIAAVGMLVLVTFLVTVRMVNKKRKRNKVQRTVHADGFESVAQDGSEDDED